MVFITSIMYMYQFPDLRAVEGLKNSGARNLQVCMSSLSERLYFVRQLLVFRHL